MHAGAQIPVVAAKLRVPGTPSYGLVRLEAVMSRLWGRKVALVVAPAGSGKTTLLSRFASRAGVAVAWYRCESWDVSQDHLLRHLAEAFTGVLGRPCQWPAVEDAVSELERWTGERLLLVIDDAHTIAGTPAERALERFIDYSPPTLLTVIASRAQPDFNLSRLRVSGALAEITGEDLRFRSWEVERLFRDFYQEPLPPVELAELARRTDGWAAGLQLFHLATSGKGLDEQRRILRGIGGSSRLFREYLARNVLDELPPLLRAFLIDTCVLGRLNGPICDRFLNRTGSERLLQELERRQIFTTAAGTDGDYRYHEVMRSHLEHVLVSEGGERALSVRYGAAGRVLEHFGAIQEALHAYCRAEDWTAVDRMLGQNGAQLARRTGVWIDALPPAVLEHDPWLLLASARRHRAEGRWQSAIEAYQRAEVGFTSLEAMQICQRERQALAAWLTPTVAPAVDSLGLLRLATMRDPIAIRAQLAAQHSAQDCLVAGLASLLGGEVAEARRLLSIAAASTDGSDAVIAGAQISAAVASLLVGTEGALVDLERAVEEADFRGQGFIARIGRAASVLAPGASATSEAAVVRDACTHLGDQWGGALAGLLEGLRSVQDAQGDTKAAATIRAAADTFRNLGAGVLETWSRSLLALSLSQQGDPNAHVAALKAENLANTTACEGPKVFAYNALAKSAGGQRSQFEQLAQSTHARTGLSASFLDLNPEPRTSLSIRCFGEFQLAIDGQPIVLSNLKPRTRSLLRRLCADAGSPVHRDILQDAFWPNADGQTAAHNLHVAISNLRQALEPGISRGASSLLVREGDSYRLVLPPGSDVDLRTFDLALERSRRARPAADLPGAAYAFHEAAGIAENELFPEEGSADWVVQRRERVRTTLRDAAGPLAQHLLANGQPAMAAHICARVLNADRYDDRLWRTLINARDQAGDEAGAHRARAEYQRILEELQPSATRS